MAVALSDDGTTALVGAPFEDCALGADCGAAHVLVRTHGTWTEQAVLTASDRLAGDASHALVVAFGSCVGTLCRVGSLFVEDGGVWQEKQQLSGTKCSGGQYQGMAAALSENADRALVGMHFSTCPGDPGEAFFFAGPELALMEIPVLNGFGLAALAIVLATLGAVLLRR